MTIINTGKFVELAHACKQMRAAGWDISLPFVEPTLEGEPVFATIGIFQRKAAIVKIDGIDHVSREWTRDCDFLR